jgi:hypothetical protein
MRGGDYSDGLRAKLVSLMRTRLVRHSSVLELPGALHKLLPGSSQHRHCQLQASTATAKSRRPQLLPSTRAPSPALRAVPCWRWCPRL